MAPVKCLILDFDGVLTDNYVYTDDQGRESVRCSKLDSMGLAQLRGRCQVVVISSEKSSVVAKRCQKLKIDCIYGVSDKVEALRGYLQQEDIALEQCVFVGNDINDIELARVVPISFAVADAHSSLLRHVTYRTVSVGGQGAVREVCDAILSNEIEEFKQ